MSSNVSPCQEFVFTGVGQGVALSNFCQADCPPMRPIVFQIVHQCVPLTKYCLPNRPPMRPPFKILSTKLSPNAIPFQSIVYQIVTQCVPLSKYCLPNCHSMRPPFKIFTTLSAKVSSDQKTIFQNVIQGDPIPLALKSIQISITKLIFLELARNVSLSKFHSDMPPTLCIRATCTQLLG